MNQNLRSDSGESKRELSAYPYTSLSSALKISEAVKELGGVRTSVSKSALANHLGETEKNQSFSQRITSAKAFGLIQGRSEYALTETARRIYFPTSDSDKSNALLECLSTPSAFRELVKRFDGNQLPRREILANILHADYEVPESWRDRVAAFFDNSAQFLGVIDGNRCLRIKAAQRSADSQAIPSRANEPNDAAPPVKKNPGEFRGLFSDQEEHSLVLDKDKTRRFTINGPLFISRAEYERICKWIEVTLIVENEKKIE